MSPPVLVPVHGRAPQFGATLRPMTETLILYAGLGLVVLLQLLVLLRPAPGQGALDARLQALEGHLRSGLEQLERAFKLVEGDVCSSAL